VAATVSSGSGGDVAALLRRSRSLARSWALGSVGDVGTVTRSKLTDVVILIGDRTGGRDQSE
jgi:hypothetical protein